jgi:hypothetical protein
MPVSMSASLGITMTALCLGVSVRVSMRLTVSPWLDIGYGLLVLFLLELHEDHTADTENEEKIEKGKNQTELTGLVGSRPWIGCRFGFFCFI